MYSIVHTKSGYIFSMKVFVLFLLNIFLIYEENEFCQDFFSVFWVILGLFLFFSQIDEMVQHEQPIVSLVASEAIRKVDETN